MIDRDRERGLANDYVRKLNIATDSIDKRVINLSGGNQQKVVVAKWLATGPEILILNDPDPGHRRRRQVRDLLPLRRAGAVRAGAALHLVGDRGDAGRLRPHLVFHKGRIIREFARGEATKADVMHWVAGGIIPEVERVTEAEGDDPRLTSTLQGD